MRKLGPATISLSALSLNALPVSASYAQAPATPSAQEATPSAPDGSQAGDIVVTAQRKAENLQDTPIAVTALTAETTQALGLVKVSDIAAVTPGANFTVSSGFFSPNIRGLGVAFTQRGWRLRTQSMRMARI